jgi:two-component system phosphate regulon sensor histidine kinase PhoR
MLQGETRQVRDMEVSRLHDGAAALRRERALFDLAKRDKSDVSDTFRAITEASAVVLDVARVGIWRLLPDGSGIECQDGFCRDEHRHTRGEILLARDFPSYFRALSENRVITAQDARADPRTRELALPYLDSHDICSMMDVPIWHKGHAFGVLCHEQVGAARRWSSDNEIFAANLADVASLSLEAGERRDGERRWQAVVDAIAEAVFVMDTEGRFVQMNAMAVHLTELAGGGLTLADRHKLVEFRDAAGQLLPPERSAGSRTLRGETVRGEVRHLFFKHSGERRSYRVTSAPFAQGDGKNSVVAVLADVTDEVYIERLKHDMLAALAHELKTPVAIVKGYVQHMRREAEAPPRRLRMLGAIERAANRLERLIGELIGVSSVSLGRLVLAREPVDLTALARSVIDDAPAAANRHRIRLHAPGPVMVMADRPRIEQVIRALVDNSIRYSPQGGDIDVEVTPATESAVLSVRDHGLGVPAQQQGHIFEMFFRAHAGTADDFGGLGIGLFLAREIVLRHKGEMWFESVEGSGSTFYLRLPRAEQP